MRAVLDRLVAHPEITAAMRACGCTERLFWLWMAESNKQTNERFRFEWGGEVRWFFEHFRIAQKRNIILLEGYLRETIQLGQKRQVVTDGKIAYAHDPKLLADALDPDLWEMLHWPRPITDTYARGEAGELLREYVIEPPAAHLQIRGAQAYLPNLWGDRKTVDLNAKTSGVLVIKRQFGPPPAPAVEQTAEQQAIEDDAADDAREPNASPPTTHNPEPPPSHPVNASAESIAKLKQQLAERNARVAAAAAARPTPTQRETPARYLTMKERGALPSPSSPTPEADREDHVGVGPDPSRRGGAIGFKAV
jgi:hypothetical protein